MLTIRRIIAVEPQSLLPLCQLLLDAVEGGASVGFLAPLSIERAERYWNGVFDRLQKGLSLWVAELDGHLIGSVQLDACGMDNGKHRAELHKLFVLRTYRGQGVSSSLMKAVEKFARENGKSLLVLDTQSGSLAEAVYRQHGWQFVGYIPGYAASPDGQLQTTAYFYKQIVP